MIGRASCPTCGDSEFRTDEAFAYYVRFPNTFRVKGWYVFRCENCKEYVSQSGEPRIIELLRDSGVPVKTIAHPPELNEPHFAGPISSDDVIEFHVWLSSLPEAVR